MLQIFEKKRKFAALHLYLPVVMKALGADAAPSAGLSLRRGPCVPNHIKNVNGG